MHRNYHLSYDQTLIIMVFSVGALRLNRKRLKRVDSLIVIGRPSGRSVNWWPVEIGPDHSCNAGRLPGFSLRDINIMIRKLRAKPAPYASD